MGVATETRSPDASRKIGLIGVGLMGHGIAKNLMAHGHELCFLDHVGNQPVADLLAQGAVSLSSAAAVAARSEVVILCVTGSPQVEAVLFEPEGVMVGVSAGALIIDCSTAIPSSTRQIEERVTAQGVRFLDAAMTRTPKEAEEGRLNLIVGAADELFAEVKPLLQAFAEHITHVGPVGMGHQVKLLHNYVSLSFCAVLAEAAAAGRRAGIDAAALAEVLGNGGGGGAAFERLKPFMLANDPSGFRFSLANALKDLDYYAQMVDELGASHRVSDSVGQLYRQANEQGHGNAIVPELIDLLARDQ
ncbi:NAD(P)-dependent oxidoreductase [Marinobacter changyiensis]|uniref:NAD(P)-dependent oxidoreductase n=1 Tax=Marinobacter changyiensis TaxID=2604091 RepID=UPI001264E94E|nr:NAD(P)-dependent oxidoreductase [Marinobacter changyiensis]